VGVDKKSILGLLLLNIEQVDDSDFVNTGSIKANSSLQGRESV
jgi:hypothetical protein